MNGDNYGSRPPGFPSSYGDPRYQPAGAADYPPTKVLVDGYRSTLDGVDEKPRYNPLNPSHPHSSSLLNIRDPVAMHLLMETAMADSMDFEVLSYEEAEELKKEYSLLSNRIQAAKRKLALENKLREAAQSMNRLYSTKGRRESGETHADGTPKSPRKQRRSFLSRRDSGSDVLSRTDDELAITTRKCEEIAQEIWRLERRAQELQKRILEHTAGILQMTHKGLKKNTRKDELPQSPESMLASNHRSGHPLDGIDEFDDRSLYKESEHLDEYGNSQRGSSRADTQTLQNTEQRLKNLNNRLRDMILQANPDFPLDMAPQPLLNGASAQAGAQLQAHLAYLEKGLEAMDSAQTKALQNIERNIYDAEERLEDLNLQLHTMLNKSSSRRSPTIAPPPSSSDGNLQAQMSYLGVGLDHLEQQIERSAEEKGILTTQIQQQRELNTKSDAERDTQISSLTQELAQAKRSWTSAQEEARSKSDELVLITEQLDYARQDAVIKEQQRSSNESNAVKAAEEKLMAELKMRQDQISKLENMVKAMQNDAEAQAKEMKELEGEVVRAQTELTVVRAELDGAYGSRAQRAADVSANPAIQREIDDLNERNTELQKELERLKTHHETAGNAELQERVATLQKELKETIEDYEVMTRASIEVEKERESLENMIDGLRERCETLETQWSDERVRWLGMKSPGAVSRDGGPAETTSTMVLKNEFKKMMRDTRAENIKALRAEQEERRRLEGVIRNLKKEQQSTTGSKSGLSQSVSAS